MNENLNDRNLPIVQFSTKLSLDDYSKAFMINLFYKQKRFWRVGLFYLIILSGISYFILPNPFIFSVSFLIIWLIVFFFWSRHTFLVGINKNKINFEKINWNVHRDFMYGVAETFETKICFKDVTRFFCKGGYYIIYSTKKNFVFIPQEQIKKDKVNMFNEVMHYNNNVKK
jgi:hypothetical protein